MEVNSFSYQTLRNSSYLFMGFALPMVFTIFVTRALAGNLGVAEFGIYLLVNTISSFVGYVDLGLSTAITKYTAEYLAKNDLTSLQNLLSSARSMFLMTGGLGLLIFGVIGLWFLPLFHVSGQSQTHIFVVFALGGLIFFLNSFGLVYVSVLMALQRFDVITKLSMGNLIAVSLGTILLLNLSFQLKAVMAINLLAVIINLLLMVYYTHKLMPQLKLKFGFNRKEINKAYRFGFQTFVSNLASVSLQYLDRLIIPIFLGPSQLAFYSVPGNVAIKISGVTNSFAGMFFPMASSFQGSGELDRLKNIYIRAFRNLSLVAAATTLAIIMFADKILLYWLGSDFADKGTTILRVLAITYYFISLYIPLQSILLGLGKIRFLIKQSLLMSGINLILLLVLIPKFGILGAAWAYLIAVLPMAYAFYWVERKLFGMKDQTARYLPFYFRLFFVGLVDVFIIYFVILPFATNVWRLVILGPLSVLLYCALFYFFGFVAEEDKIIFKSFFWKFFRLDKFTRA